jgi:hypothetical protein
LAFTRSSPKDRRVAMEPESSNALKAFAQDPLIARPIVNEFT